MMHSPGINGEEQLKGQPANPGSSGKIAVKTVCVCMCVCNALPYFINMQNCKD